MPWATVSDVSLYTGIAVGSDNLEAAQAVVELFAGTTEAASDAGNISSTNLRHLKRAVAYQAAWMTAHPDLYTSMSISSMTEGAGGMSIDLAHQNAGVLSPLARASIQQLSWKSTRSIRVRPRNARARRLIEEQARMQDLEDDYGDWEAL